MRRKSIIFIIMAIFAVFSVVNVALAVNRVEVKVTSEPIPYQTPCDKAGSFSLSFDPGTRIAHGDQITIDLPLNVTICRTIDFVISPYNDTDVAAMTGTGYGFTGPGATLNIPPRLDPDTGDTTNAPVIYNEGENELNPVASVNITDDGTGGVWFYVHGTQGTRRITVDVYGDTSVDGNPVDAYLDLGRDADDALIIRFLDQWVNWDATRAISNAGQDARFDNPATFAAVSAPNQYSTNGIWIDEDNDTNYDETANYEDNTLCINTSQYANETVNASLDSWADKFTFIPSNPQIAHPADPEPISELPCKSATCGRITIGSGGQFGGTCTNFDNETGAGYCAGTHTNNKLVLEASNLFDMNTQYQVQLTILVNGVEGENGVYFSSDAVQVGASSTNLTNTCGWVTTSGALGDTHYRYSNGAYTTVAAPVASDSDCSIASGARAVRVLTDATAFIGANNIRYLYIDIPSFVYDTSQISEGDAVTVQYELRKFPCGTIATGDHCIGTFGCAAATVTRQLFYPYFTSFSPEDSFWDGIVITNVDDTAGTATITVYEADGDISSMTATVNAGAQYVNLLSEMAGSLTATANSAGDGTIGNSTSYVVVCTDFDCDGFAMIADTSEQGESMGYLPRNNPAAAGTVFQSAGTGAGFDSYDLCD